MASTAEAHGRLRQWPEARRLAARAAELAPGDANSLQARLLRAACSGAAAQSRPRDDSLLHSSPVCSGMSLVDPCEPYDFAA